MNKPLELKIEYVFNQKDHSILFDVNREANAIALSPHTRTPGEIQPHVYAYWRPLRGEFNQMVDITYRITPRVHTPKYKATGLSGQVSQVQPRVINHGQEIAHFYASFYKGHCETLSAHTAGTGSEVMGIRASAFNNTGIHRRKLHINPALPVIQYRAIVKALNANSDEYLQAVGRGLGKLDFGSSENKRKLFNAISREKTLAALATHDSQAVIDYFLPLTDLDIALEDAPQK